MPSVKDLMPNVPITHEVLLFKDYVCIEHFPFKRSSLLGLCLGDVLQMMEIDIPYNFSYCFLRDDHAHFSTIIKENGGLVRIINTKILFPQNEQDPSHGN